MNRREVLSGLGVSAISISAVPKPLVSSVDLAARLAPVLARYDVDEHPDLRGIVVFHRGARLAERYYNGESPMSLHDIRSAGKSITSLLVGAAVDRGMIKSVSDSVQDYWPSAAESAIGNVSLADLLTMRSGLAANDELPESPGNEDKFDLAADPTRFLLDIPRAAPPGTAYIYNSMTAYTAGLVVEKASGEREAAFAKRVLFAPLGIERFTWASDVAGHTKGQGNLSVTTRDLASIGQMVLDGGRFAGRRVISASWIAELLKPRVKI